MKIFISLSLLLFSFQIFGQTSWSLQITDPNYELVNFEVDNESFKPYLEKTSWRCYLGEVNKNNGLYKRTLRCNYSSKKSGEFEVLLSCGKENKLGETSLELVDEKKDLRFKIRLSCRYTGIKL